MCIIALVLAGKGSPMERLTWRQRFSAFAVAAVACLFVSATPAHAAAPTNDDFAAATEITSLPFSETLDASEASAEPGEEALCSGATPSVWYRFTPDRDISIKAEATDNITYRSVSLAVYTGSSLDALSLVACGTQSPLGYYTPQLVSFDATGGTTYYIRAAGFTGRLGTVTLDVTELIRPANDNRANAEPLDSPPASVTGDTTNATLEAGEERPCGGNTGSVWYSFTTVTASDLWFQPAFGLAVYDGNGGLLSCGEPFRTEAGGTYLIQVVSYPTPGPFTFDVGTYTPITGSISVNPSAPIDRFGRVTVTGTLRCTGDFATGFIVSVLLQQKVGKQPVAEGAGYGDYYASGLCDGRSNPWTAYVSSETSSAFWTGSMTVTPSAFVFTDPYFFQTELTGLSTTKISVQRAK